MLTSVLKLSAWPYGGGMVSPEAEGSSEAVPHWVQFEFGGLNLAAQLSQQTFSKKSGTTLCSCSNETGGVFSSGQKSVSLHALLLFCFCRDIVMAKVSSRFQCCKANTFI